MNRARFSEEQIISILKRAEAGVSVVDLCRQHGFSDATFYKWRSAQTLSSTGTVGVDAACGQEVRSLPLTFDLV